MTTTTSIGLHLNPRSYIYSSNVETLVLQSALAETRLSFVNAAAPDQFRYVLDANDQELSLSSLLSNNTLHNFTNYKSIANNPTIENFGTTITSNLTISSSSPLPYKLVTLRDVNPHGSAQYSGLGVLDSTGTSMVYQTPFPTSSHIFQTGISTDTSTEIMRMQLSSIGVAQVSIGTSNIQSNIAFQVKGNTNLTGDLVLNSIHVDPALYVQLDPTTQRVSPSVMPTGTVITSSPSNTIDPSVLPPPTSNTPMFRSTRYFGLGTRNPKQMLHVEGNAYVSDRVGVGSDAMYPAARLHAVESSAVIPTALLYNTVGGDVLHTYVSNTPTDTPIPVLSVVGTNSGGVGIGTDSVSSHNKLQVVGNTDTTSLSAKNVVVNESLTSTNLQNINISTTDGKTLLLWNPYINTLNTNIPTVINTTLTVQNDLTVNGQTLLHTSPLIFSDMRMKQNVRPITNSTDILQNVHGYTYEMIGSYIGGRQAGVIAQEVQSVFPEAVFTSPNGFMSVRYDSLVPVLIEAVNSLTQRVTYLENKLNSGNMDVDD